MPLSDGNPFVLSRLVPGVAYTGDLKFSRPFDNAGTLVHQRRRIVGRQRVLARRIAQHGERPARGLRASGGRGAGIQGRRRRASTPATDTPPARWSTSRSRAAPTRSRAQGYYYMRDEKLSATDFFVNKSGGEKPALRYNRFGGRSADRCGPGYKAAIGRSSSRRPSGSTTSSPSLVRRPCPPRRCATATFRRCWRRASPSTIRDGALDGGFVLRSPFPSNIIPQNRINPVARAVLRLLPGAEPARRRAGAQQLLLDQSAHRRLLLDLDARRSPADRPKQQLFVALRAQRPHGIAQRCSGEVNGVRPDRQLPVPRSTTA